MSNMEYEELIKRIEKLEKQQHETTMIITNLVSTMNILANRVIEMGEILTMMGK